MNKLWIELDTPDLSSARRTLRVKIFGKWVRVFKWYAGDFVKFERWMSRYVDISY